MRVAHPFRGVRPPARRALLALLLAGGAWACGGDTAESDAGGAVLPPGMTPSRPMAQSNADLAPPAVPFVASTPRYRATAVQSWPHDAQAYTQGLIVSDGRLYESTGLEGASSLRRVDLQSGRVLQRHALPGQYFGEGIAVAGDRLYQLTWKAGKGWIYDPATLAPVDSFTYEGEGWGLASDGERLYLSDGSSQIRVVTPDGFQVERAFQVTEGGQPVHALNELEWMNGELLANVYNTDWIARIDPATGEVRGWIDVGNLLTTEEQMEVGRQLGVANGIAWDARNDRLLVTGKMWPRLFAVALQPL